eukprot:11187587-Lingulodinium_polyedra.AAC.1
MGGVRAVGAVLAPVAGPSHQSRRGARRVGAVLWRAAYVGRSVVPGRARWGRPARPAAIGCRDGGRCRLPPRAGAR